MSEDVADAGGARRGGAGARHGVREAPSSGKDTCPDGGSESQDMIRLRLEHGHSGGCERNRLWTGEGGSRGTRANYM